MTEENAQVTVSLYTPDNEIEAEQVRLVLEKSGVPCTVVSFRDRAYPGVIDRERPWGEIRVREADAERAEQLVAEYLDAEPVLSDLAEADTREQPAGAAAKPAASRAFPLRTVLFVALFLASVVMNVSMALEIRSYTRTHDERGQPIWEWTSTQSGVAFDARGRPVQELFDDDGDGRFELIRSIHNGEAVGEWHDRDGDGIYEEQWSLRDGARVARFFDENADGTIERSVKLKAPDQDVNQAFPQSFDRDADAVVDLVACKVGESLVRIFDTNQCALRPDRPLSTFDPKVVAAEVPGR